jgi:ribosomal protein S12 methylthiotransferase
MKYRIVSLGCPKNLVDAEYMAGRLDAAGHELSDDAPLVVVNTCAFVAEACSESIETILAEAGKGGGGKLVVTGCLVDRYGEKLRELLPEVDLFLTRDACGDAGRIVTAKGFFARDAAGQAGGREDGVCGPSPRKVLTPTPTTYLRIQDGCDNRCSYCTIPSIRGPLKSRPIDEIEEEFGRLLEAGFREFNVIGQDTTAYGKDRGADIKGLLKRLLAVEGDYFLRLLYLHPKGIDDALLELIAGDERMIPYLDVPIQHSEDAILASMNRGYSKKDLAAIFGKIRSIMADSVLRTTVMVGYPGEGPDHFQALCDFISEWEFDNLGAFAYSREEGTPAARLKGQVRKGVKKERYMRVMELQGEISKKRLKRLKGRTVKVVVEAREADAMTGRLLLQAPDIDGIAFIKGACAVGEIRAGVVTATTDYDVVVELRRG